MEFNIQLALTKDLKLKTNLSAFKLHADCLATWYKQAMEPVQQVDQYWYNLSRKYISASTTALQHLHPSSVWLVTNNSSYSYVSWRLSSGRAHCRAAGYLWLTLYVNWFLGNKWPFSQNLRQSKLPRFVLVVTVERTFQLHKEAKPLRRLLTQQDTIWSQVKFTYYYNPTQQKSLEHFDIVSRSVSIPQ